MAVPEKATGRLRARIVAREALSHRVRDAMWAVFSRYYDEVDRERFEHDLAAKHHVILLADGERVAGFSTLQRYVTRAGGRRYAIVFSGDTIVERGYWGQRALQRAFYRYVLATKLRHPALPLYWFLISKGYRTYLLLTRNFVEYWPRHDLPTPARVQALLDGVARDKFGAAWQPSRGILHFEARLGRLRDSVAPLTAELLLQPDVRFFAERNPGHARGDELCCLGRVDARFALAYAHKTLRRVLRRGSRSVPSLSEARE